MQIKASTLNSYRLSNMLFYPGINQYIILLYAGLFLIFSFRIIPDDIVLALALLLFIITPIEDSILLYVFSFIWCDVAVFSVGITYSLIISVLLFFRIIIAKKGKLKMLVIDYIVLFYLGGMALLSFLNNGSLTAFGILLYYFNAIYIRELIKGKPGFTYNFFLIILISTLIGTIYGFREGTSIERWVAGYGSIFQMYGTLGTTRFAIYLCSSMIFPLYYDKNKIRKYIVFSVLSLFLFLTVSLTGTLIYIGLLCYYAFTGTENKKRVLIAIASLVLLLIIVVANWNMLYDISFLKPLAMRMDGVIHSIRSGNIDAALTGRAHLGNDYMQFINSRPFLTRLFGDGEVLIVVNNYSHNSYLDLVQFYGYIGLVGFVIVIVTRIYEYRNCLDFKQILLFKGIMMVAAFTVSIFTAFYWQVPILL